MTRQKATQLLLIEPPMIDDIETTNGYMDANLLSKLFWCFPAGILSRASNRPLGPHDIHQIAPTDKAEVISTNIMREWEQQVAKSKRTNTKAVQQAITRARQSRQGTSSVEVELTYPSFFLSVVYAYGLFYFACSCMLLAYSGCKIGNVLLLRQLVAHVRLKDTIDAEAAWHGLLFAIGMALCAVLQAVIHHFFFHSTMRIGAQLKAGAMGVLYQKSLRLTASAFAKTSIGHALNILSSDTNQFQVAGPFIAYILFAPLETIVGIYLISREIGVSALFGAAVIVLMVLYQFYTSFKFASIRTSLVRFTDQRVKLLNEVLNADIVKMYAWEEPLRDKVLEERRRELKHLRQNITFKGINLAAFFASVSLIHMATFAGHVARGGVLTSEVTFTVIGYYNAIVFPMVQYFPFGIEKLSEIWIASKRVERFLMLGDDLYHKDQVDPSFHHDPHGADMDKRAIDVHPPATMDDCPTTIELTGVSMSVVPSEGMTEQVSLASCPQPSPGGQADRVGMIRVNGITFRWPSHSSTVHTHTQRHVVAAESSIDSEAITLVDKLIETSRDAAKLEQKSTEEQDDRHIATKPRPPHHAEAPQDSIKTIHTPDSGVPSGGDVQYDTLENIGLTLHPGTLTCIVGSVGSGKSSLLLAFMGEMPRADGTGSGLYEGTISPSIRPPPGATTIPLSTDMPAPQSSNMFPSPYINGTISYASQRAWLLAASVRDNITFGTPFDKERYINAVYSCGLGHDFSLFPDSDAMYIAENGKSLSGGQRSRLCICRAIYRDADVYMFDDVLAAVDQVVAEHIFHNVMGPSGTLAGKTRVLVTHALAFLPFADQVIVMHEGHVVSVGTYDEVRATGWLDDDKMLTGSAVQKTLAADSYKNEEGLEVSKHSIVNSSGHVNPSDNSRAIHQCPRQQTDSPSTPASTVLSAPQQHDARRIAPAQTQYISITHEMTGGSGEQGSIQFNRSDIREIVESADQARAALRNIITIEKRAEGHTSIRLYRDFLIGDRLPIFLLVILALLTPAALRLWADIVLADWAAQTATEQQTDLYYRNLFIVLSSCTVFIALFRALLCMRHLLHSSTVFFEKQLNGVMFSPLSFFQANPTGRILNRLSKDQSITDELLPATVFDFLQVTMMVISTFCIIGVVAPYILLILVILLPLFYYLRRRYVRASRDVQRVEATSRSPIFTHFTTTMAGLAVIRAFQLQGPFMDVFHHYVDLNTRAFLEFYYVSRWLGIRLDLTCAVITLLAGIFATYAGIDTDLAGLILTYASTLGFILQWSVRQSTMVENQFAAVERILEYAYLPSEESAQDVRVEQLSCVDDDTHGVLVDGKEQHLITSHEDIAKILKDGLSRTLQLIDDTNAKVEVLRKLIQRDEERQLSDAKGSTQKKSSSACCGGDPSTAAGEQPPPEAQDVEYDIETNYAEYANLSYEEKTSQLKAELHTLHTLQPECLSAPPAPLDHASDAPLHSSTVKRILYHPPANWPHAGAISFQSVVLTYRDGLAPVLKGLSFDITPGMKVGICGRTGAGKSSAIGVLYRLFPICYGRVMVDGIDISHVPLHTLRSMLAIIPQSPFIFSDTIRYNLDPFDEHTDEDIYRVLKKVRLFSLVNSFPDKLNTLMSESGANISQGQCQLLCIGRALLKQSKVLLVDEATANIDPASDAIIQRVLQTEFHDRTVITIAHRLQTIMHCDMIMLLDSGNVMETGSPQELLALNGVFASMYEAQKQQELNS